MTKLKGKRIFEILEDSIGDRKIEDLDCGFNAVNLNGIAGSYRPRNAANEEARARSDKKHRSGMTRLISGLLENDKGSIPSSNAAELQEALACH